MAKRTDLKKILIIGSGPIVIGQAAEFDYAGTQACLALKEEGYEVVLVNSNPATIMTDTTIADKVYMEPLTLEYVAKILRYERPDAIVPGIGGQTGLNLAMQLEKKGILKECHTELLGTSSESIERAEDRELFKELCQSIGEPVIPSEITYNLDEAKAAAARIGYPLMQVLEEEFQKSGAEYFFYGEEMAVFFNMERLEVPLFFMEEMLLQYGVREKLILIGSPNLLFESVFRNFMQKVNYLNIICEQPEEYEEETEWLFENYGIVARFETEKERVRKAEKRQVETLVVDMENSGKNGRPRIELAGLPEGAVYMDMCSEGEKARWITKKRKDIHYLSPESLLNKWCHLDTNAQNGYNTRVKLEVL